MTTKLEEGGGGGLNDLATIEGSFLRLPFLKNRIRKFSGAGEYFAYIPLFLTTSLSPKKII